MKEERVLEQIVQHERESQEKNEDLNQEEPDDATNPTLKTEAENRKIVTLSDEKSNKFDIKSSGHGETHRKFMEDSNKEYGGLGKVEKLEDTKSIENLEAEEKVED